jgi:uncharacterized protein
MTTGLSTDGATGLADRRGHELDVTPLAVLLARIIAHWQPSQIWLFGSRARGDAGDDSDWDLLVVAPDDAGDDLDDPLVGWRLQKGSGVYADIATCRAGEFAEARTTTNTLAYEAWMHGVLLHEG